jgi:hypothetical protein
MLWRGVAKVISRAYDDSSARCKERIWTVRPPVSCIEQAYRAGLMYTNLCDRESAQRGLQSGALERAFDESLSSALSNAHTGGRDFAEQIRSR